MKHYRIKIWLVVAVLAIASTTALAACSDKEDTLAGRPTVERIEQRGTLLVGTTGDYRPLSFREPETGLYWGFAIELAEAMAKRMGVAVEFVPTSWPTLTADVQAEPQLFDMAMGGITITETRCATMLMSEGYLANGKTILCRTEDTVRFRSLQDIDRPEVTVMVNTSPSMV